MHLADLASHLRLRTPVVWVTTSEPARLVDRVLALVSDRPVYRIDALDGLLVRTDEGWRKQLIDVGGNVVAGPLPLMTQIEFVLSNSSGTLVLDSAHTLADALLSHVTTLAYRWRQTYLNDDADLLPPQLLLASRHDRVPDDLAPLVAHVSEHSERTDLAQVATRLADSAGWNIDAGALADAGAGLTESAFVDSLLGAALHEGTPSAAAVHAAKVASIKSGGLLEIRPVRAGLDAIGGLDVAKDLLARNAWLRTHPQVAADLDIAPLRRVLLIGVAGSGKSLVCEVAAQLLDLDLAKGGVSQAMNKYVGESEARMREMFRLLRLLAPIVLWIDEFGRDASGGQSSAGVDAGTTDRVHGEFLTGLQNLPDDVFLLAAANSLAMLPPEMTRADRFDKVLFVGLPTHSEREEIFRIHLGARASEYDTDALAEASPFFTGAEIKTLIREVRWRVGTSAQRIPSTDELLAGLAAVRSRAWVTHRADIVGLYNAAMSAWDWASSAQQADAESVLRAAARNGQVHPVRSTRTLHSEW